MKVQLAEAKVGKQLTTETITLTCFAGGILIAFAFALGDDKRISRVGSENVKKRRHYEGPRQR